MTRMFLLGIDGLPSWMWRQLADQGVMPFSKSLLATGQLVSMQSAIPEVSSAAWTSIVTGVNPGQHNVYGFTDLIDGSYTLGFTSSRTLKAAPFWQQQDGLRRLIINVPQTYPAQPLHGKLVSGFVALDLAKAVFPPEELTALEALNYRVDADMSLVEQSKSRFLDELEQVLATRLQALESLWKSAAWDEAMFVITGTDRLNHYLWEDFEDASSPYRQRFLDFYRRVDRAIERIVNLLEDDSTLVVVSDHGFGRQRASANVNRLLADAGYLAIRDAPRPSYIDMTSDTRAFAMDPGRIYLHREGRYPGGRVALDQCPALEEELTDLFLNWKVAGMKAVDRVLKGRDVYQGHMAHRAPDLVLMAAENVALSGRMNTAELIEPTLINGKHTFADSTFFIRSALPIAIPSPMRVEDVLGVIAQTQVPASEDPNTNIEKRNRQQIHNQSKRTDKKEALASKA